MNDGEHEFRVRLGRLRDGGGRAHGRAGVFVVQVLRAAVRAGHRGRGFRTRRGTAIRGRGAAMAVGLRSPSRRVVIQARVVRRSRAAPLKAHLSYLKREGVDRDGGGGRMFDAVGEADERAFARRCDGDRHHFRFMVSPEDAGQLQDLRRTTRDLMAHAGRDLGVRLDWVAVEHWNTAHPHVHVLVRGRDPDGADLVISRDYISRGLRARAEALVSLELGPRSAREIAADLQGQVAAERWTGLDRLLAALAVDGLVDLRPGAGAPDRDLHPLVIGRARWLERLGLAEPEGSGRWRLSGEGELRLRELALSRDIVKTLHRALGEGRALADLAPFGEGGEAPVVGRLVARGLADEQAGTAYVIIDALDGRAHHVRLRDLEAAGDTAIGGIVEVRPGSRGEPARLFHRSDLTLEDQVLAPGSTWLDRQLVARQPAARTEAGFGAEVAAALRVRATHLEELGLASRSAGGWRFAASLLDILRRRELTDAGERLARDTGLSFEAAPEDPSVRGVYRRRLDLASGRFAMVEDGLGFRLVPWARLLDRSLGQSVSGLMVDGRVEWDRQRDLSR